MLDPLHFVAPSPYPHYEAEIALLFLRSQVAKHLESTQDGRISVDDMYDVRRIGAGRPEISLEIHIAPGHEIFARQSRVVRRVDADVSHRPAERLHEILPYSVMKERGRCPERVRALHRTCDAVEQRYGCCAR